MSRRVLYQWTQAEVISSGSARVWIGPRRNGEPARTHSAASGLDGLSITGRDQGVKPHREPLVRKGLTLGLGYLLNTSFTASLTFSPACLRLPET